MLADEVAQPAQQVAAAGLAQILPAGDRRRPRAAASTAAATSAALPRAAEYERLAGGGVGALEVLARRIGADPFAADEVLVLLGSDMCAFSPINVVNRSAKPAVV